MGELWALVNRDLAAAGAHVDDFRYCPFHVDGTVERYRGEHPWRKLAPGMLLDLCEHWPVDVAGSFMIGDKDLDMAAAAAAGVAGFRYAEGNLADFVRDRAFDGMADTTIAQLA